MLVKLVFVVYSSIWRPLFFLRYSFLHVSYGHVCSSVVEPMFSMHEALGLIPSTLNPFPFYVLCDLWRKRAEEECWFC